MRITPAPAAVGAALLVGLTACGGSDSGGGSKGSGGSGGSAGTSGAVVVEATDTECKVSRTTAAAGTVEFQVSNKGSQVNEFYVYAKDGRVLGEVENITPGLSRSLKVELSQPGTYETACKPGMKGDGIRGDFTVTGSSATGAAKSDQKLTAAVAAYRTYVAREADELLARTTDFTAAVKAGDAAKAKKLYAAARGPWEEIEPVVESFGDLDPRIDGREDVVDEGMAFTGYHRLEKDLWKDGLQEDSAAVADQLLADVRQVSAKARAVQLNPLQLATAPRPCSTRWPPARSPARRSATATPTSTTSPPTSRAPSRPSAPCAPRSPSATRSCSPPSTPASPPSTTSSTGTAPVTGSSPTPRSPTLRSSG